MSVLGIPSLHSEYVQYSQYMVVVPVSFLDGMWRWTLFYTCTVNMILILCTRRHT